MFKKDGIFGTIFSLGKAKVNDANETLKDEFSPDLAKQHIRDAEEAIRESKQTLDGLKVDLRGATRELNETQTELATRTAQLREVVEKHGRESDLVAEILDKIKTLKEREAAHQTRVNTLQAQVDKAQSAIDTATRKISSMQERLSTMQARQKANEARKKLAESAAFDESKMSTAMDSFDRYERKLNVEGDQLDVAEENAEAMESSDLDSRLAEAGIGSSSTSDDELLDSLLAPKEKA